MPLLRRIMTKLAEGSSLLQSPKPNLAYQHPLPDCTRSLPQHGVHKKRQLDGPSVVAQVIQTVELIQVVNSDGVPVTVQTVFPPPTTRLVDFGTGDVLETIDTLSNAPPLPTDLPVDSPDIPVDITLDVPIQVPDPSSIDVPAVLPPVVPDAVGDVPPSDILPNPPPVANPVPDLSSATNLTITNSSREASSSSSTSTPLSTTAFPTLASPFNGTNGKWGRETLSMEPALTRAQGWNGTLFSNSTRFRNKSNRTSTFSLTTSESTAAVVVAATPAPETPADVAVAPPQPIPETHRGGLPDPPPTSAVVGISVGSIAGAALIIFVIMALIRWKRRNVGAAALGGGLTGSRGLLRGGDSGREMTQRSLPYSIPGVLASLSRSKQQAADPTDMPAQERSFYRVSGKKLPSVFEHGGDGYTDPRQSIVSGTSSYLGDSRLLDAEGGTPTRLALGSPMRPVSGIPIMRSGPARTPITEDNPFSDPPTPSTLFPPDSLGRSLTGQDGSRVSSRFAEEV